MSTEHRTEAACLLEQGASYRMRIGLQSPDHGNMPIFAGFKHGAFSLYFGDAPIYHFDLEGRWQRAFVKGLHYLRGLDGSVQTIDRPRSGANMVLERKALSYAVACDFDAHVRGVALDLISAEGAGRLRSIDPPAGKARPLDSVTLREFLERIIRWDANRWFRDVERYLATYGPLPLIPPDSVGAVVLQATLGHQSGAAFGGAAAAEFYERDPIEFEKHVAEVSALWGQRMLQSRQIFLAGTDVLHAPVEKVIGYLDAIGRALPIRPKSRGTREHRDADGSPRFDGIHAFLDRFEGPVPDASDFRAFADRGLIRLALGVESGSPRIRDPYGKQWRDRDLATTVASAKAAGLAISVLVLVGVGGTELAREHVEQSASLINSLPLGAGDFVFLLDEREIERPGRRITELTPLDPAKWSAQQSALKESLAATKTRGVKVLPYTMEKQGT